MPYDASLLQRQRPVRCQWLRNLIRDGLVTPGTVDPEASRTYDPMTLKDTTAAISLPESRDGTWPPNSPAGQTAPVWTASCPCQPYSLAWKTLGAEDRRNLWPECYGSSASATLQRCLESRLRARLRHGWLDGVFADLERAGLRLRGGRIASVASAPHLRQRLFWVAHAPGQPTVLGRAARTRPESRQGCLGRDLSRAVGISTAAESALNPRFPLAHGIPAKLGSRRARTSPNGAKCKSESGRTSQRVRQFHRAGVGGTFHSGGNRGLRQNRRPSDGRQNGVQHKTNGPQHCCPGNRQSRSRQAGTAPNDVRNPNTEQTDRGWNRKRKRLHGPSAAAGRHRARRHMAHRIPTQFRDDGFERRRQA